MSVLGEAFEFSDEALPVKGHGGVVAEGPEPGCFFGIGRQLPMDQPKRGWGAPYTGRARPTRKAYGQVLVGRTVFVPVGSSMIPLAFAQWRMEATMFLPTPKRAMAPVIPADVSVIGLVLGFGDAIEYFFQPPIAEREGFVSRKLRLVTVSEKVGRVPSVL